MEVGGGCNVVMTRLEDLEPQLACVTKLLIGLSCSMEGSCSQRLSPREGNDSIQSTCTSVWANDVSHSRNTRVTATLTGSVVSVPYYTRVTSVNSRVVFFTGNLSGGSRVSHASDFNVGAHARQSKRGVLWGTFVWWGHNQIRMHLKVFYPTGGLGTLIRSLLGPIVTHTCRMSLGQGYKDQPDN